MILKINEESVLIPSDKFFGNLINESEKENRLLQCSVQGTAFNLNKVSIIKNAKSHGSWNKRVVKW